MENGEEMKAFYIEAYFKDLESRVAFLKELNDAGHKNEALLLCCCYIEALGSRQSSEPGKAKNYCNVLIHQGGNEIWQMIHPEQIKRVFSEKKGLFKDSLTVIESRINAIGARLIWPQELLDCLSPLLNPEQQKWLQENIYKGSMANISYEHIRSELVHDISVRGHGISFGEITHKEQPLPRIDFDLLYPSLQKIVDDLKKATQASGKWWWE